MVIIDARVSYGMVGYKTYLINKKLFILEFLKLNGNWNPFTTWLLKMYYQPKNNQKKGRGVRFLLRRERTSLNYHKVTNDAEVSMLAIF